MKRTYTIILTTLLVALFATTGALAQENGDFRSSEDGNWSAIQWQQFDGTDWSDVGGTPNTDATIYIRAEDSVDVDTELSLSGHLIVEGDDTNSGGLVNATETGGSLTIEDGGTYEHNRDGGEIPAATWNAGSTVTVTGMTGNTPDRSNQDFHHVVWNSPDQGSNAQVGWGADQNEILGDVTVINTGSARFHMTWAGRAEADIEINIAGDLVVEGGQATATGSGDEQTYFVNVGGNVVVHEGGNLAPSRGSGGNAEFNVTGNFTVHEGATLQNSNENDLGGFVFNGTNTQTIEVDEGASYTGAINYTVATDASVEIAADTDFLFENDFLVQEDGSVTIDGTFITDGEGAVTLEGDMDVNDGATYAYARNEGGPGIPDANWNEGSTVTFTGLEGGAPEGSNRDFYNVVFDNPDQASNFDLGWGSEHNRIGGDVHIANTGGNQLRLTWAGRADTNITINIDGNVLIEGENTEVTTTGSGDLQTYFVNIGGDLTVRDGGYLAASRGSSGQAVWNLYGDLNVDGGTLGDSDDHPQQESYTFAADTASGGVPSQNATVNNISYNGPAYFRVADSSGVFITEGSEFEVEDTFFNEGVIEAADGALVFVDGGVYEHARDGGNVPTATWEEGSTALFTGIEGSGPGNASQDFYNIVLDVPNNASNNDFDMDGNTIYGDIDIVTTGSSRFYLTTVAFEEEREITIMGDVIMRDGAFSTNGTGSGDSQIIVNHHGDIIVEDGNFSISRGSGPYVEWNLLGGSFDFQAGVTQNSAPREGSFFVFAGEDTVQHLSVTEDVELDNLPWAVEEGAYLDIGTSNFGGMSELIEVRDGATIASSDSAAFERNVEAEATLSSEAHYVINGDDEPQATGFSLPLQVASLTIDNEAGVTQSRTIAVSESLILESGVFDNSLGITLGDDAEVINNGGSLLIPMDGIPIGTFALTSPEDGSELDLTGDESTEVVIEWETAASAEDITYTWHADSVDGDFSDPLVSIPSNDEGSEASLTLTYEAIDSVVADLGVEEGEDIDLIWTVTAETEDTLRFADESFEINIARNLGVSNENEDNLPTEFALEQNYPNPFNPSTTIQYDVPEASDVTLEVFDITGRQVAELVNTRQSAGSYTVEWNAQNFATGVYIYRLTAGDFTSVRKLTLIK